MLIKEKQIILNGKPVFFVYFEYDDGDKKKRKVLFTSWKTTNELLKSFGARGANLPEGISETAFCMVTGAVRFKEVKAGGKKVHASFDTFDLDEGRTQQIKASSIEFDLSSFGPRSEWDDLYFMDFYNNGKLDGYFDIYKIPTEYIYASNMNENQSFQDQQEQGRRPRFSIKKDIIIPNNIKPIYTHVTV